MRLTLLALTLACLLSTIGATASKIDTDPVIYLYSNRYVFNAAENVVKVLGVTRTRAGGAIVVARMNACGVPRGGKLRLQISHVAPAVILPGDHLLLALTNRRETATGIPGVPVAHKLTPQELHNLGCA